MNRDAKKLADVISGSSQPTAAQGATVPQSRLLAQFLQQSASDPPTIRSGAELGTRLLAQAVGRVGMDKAAGQEDAQRQAALQHSAEALFPNDPRGQALFIVNQKAATDALAENYKPAVVGGGDTRDFGIGVHAPFTAPKLGVDGGFAYSQTPEQTTWQGERPENYVEQQGGIRLGADLNHLINQDAVARGELDVHRGQLHVNQAAYQARLRGQGGFGTPGTAVSPLSGVSDAELLSALRGQ